MKKIKKATVSLTKKEVVDKLNKQLNSPTKFIISPIDISLLKKKKININRYAKDLQKVNAKLGI
ncbi:MAG TPA: hypothetical protein P5530_02030 [Candidatus Diapherotrites archaeon]|nr:hypothetical protein [Candidatus Diapherotrites archaeon]